ncbi:MAG TPA: GNAT family N-acetyltransferase [Thermomicrobiales bacterium]|nr:GNAT family N-acetyltransferase [Thermomicrobiales bacterium]
MPDVAIEPKKIAGPALQTALVGDLVYLRPIYADDAATGTSWRQSVFPESTSRVESWIEENLGKEGPEKKETLAIVRKSDDLVVGSIVLEHELSATIANVRVDPIHGPAGLVWKGEAIVLVGRWVVDERHAVIMHVDVTANETSVIATIEAGGFRQSARFREMRFIDGRWVDLLMYDYANALWVARLGHPAEIPLERTGTGEPRPVPARVTLTDDPPRGAILVGERVYLRAFETKDADESAVWGMREPETFHTRGRGAYSPAATLRELKEAEAKELPTYIAFMVCLRGTDEFIGAVELFDVDPVHRNAETGSWFHKPEYRGGGYGSEAKQLLLGYAFNHLRLHMVHSWVLFSNTRSAAALRKQGYKEAGRANWLYPAHGTLSNMVVFDLLADEWRAMPRT